MQNTLPAIRGMVVGSVIGDALGMPLEFHNPTPAGHLLREMEAGRLPSGTFTDDTELSLALSESLLAHSPLDASDLVRRFVTWLQFNPPDIGVQTGQVLRLIASGYSWQDAARSVQQNNPDSSGNGSLMRVWPIAAAHHDQPGLIIAESRLQSEITHPHPDCTNACVFLNLILADLIHRDSSKPPTQALRESMAATLARVLLGSEFELMVKLAPVRQRDQLKNTGWVRHTLESALWAALNSTSFEEALVNVVNLGNDADTAGCVTGALAGAMYGLEGIPTRWVDAIHGEYPPHSGRLWFSRDFIRLADDLAAGSQ